MIKTSLVLFVTLSALNACPGFDERCASCVGTQCRVCFDGYINAQGKCQRPQNIINNCLEYVGENTCKFCQHEYYVNSRGTCSRISNDDCLEVDQLNPSQCLMCEDNILVQNGICNDDIKCRLDNCKLCTN